VARRVDVEGSRPEWDELRQSLRGYGNLAALLAEWHRAYMLAGARRLLDDSKGVSSPIRALRLVSRHADKVTLDVLAAGFAGNQYETEHRRHLEEHLIELAGGPGLDRHSSERSDQRLASQTRRGDAASPRLGRASFVAPQ